VYLQTNHDIQISTPETPVQIHLFLILMVGILQTSSFHSFGNEIDQI